MIQYTTIKKSARYIEEWSRSNANAKNTMIREIFLMTVSGNEEQDLFQTVTMLINQQTKRKRNGRSNNFKVGSCNIG
jgi:hypothetical protein